MIIDKYDGYLVEDNLEKFKTAVLSLINDKAKLDELSANAYKNAEENYFASAISKKLETLYNKVINKEF